MKIINNPIQKEPKPIRANSPKEKKANDYVKRCSISCTTRETQREQQRDTPVYLLWWPISRRWKCQALTEVESTGRRLHDWWELELRGHFGTCLAGVVKVKEILTIWPSTYAPWDESKEAETICLCRNLHTDVHSKLFRLLNLGVELNLGYI